MSYIKQRIPSGCWKTVHSMQEWKSRSFSQDSAQMSKDRYFLALECHGIPAALQQGLRDATLSCFESCHLSHRTLWFQSWKLFGWFSNHVCLRLKPPNSETQTADLWTQTSYSEIQTAYSESQTMYFWDLNHIFLRLKPHISETQTTHFWDSNHVFLRLKLYISETQTIYFWDSNYIFLRFKPCNSKTQTAYF